MWDNDLERAKKAIQRKDYQTARTILEMMPENYIARDWLAKLNRKNLKFRHEEPYISSSQLEEKPSSQEVSLPAVGIVALNMLFWVFFILSTSMMNPLSSEIQARNILIVVGALIGLPILYYFFWRWFWWSLAGVWLLITFSFIIALAQGFQLNFLFQ